MRASYNWLKDYVDIELSPQALAKALTVAGDEVTSIQKWDGDWRLELEITPNRPDCLNIIGIAREIAAITGKRLKLPNVPSTIKPSQSHKIFRSLRVEVEDKIACPRYSARVITGIRVKPSPAWLAKRLQAMGIRPVNNIVDITNFCLMELGQPLHTFDYNKLKSGKIIVRRSRENEEIVTIDGVKRPLDKGTLVIADPNGPIAIAGIMGGLDTEISENTKSVVLESAYFDPVTVRRTSRKLGLTTESSYRFERNVDIKNIIVASNRATALIKELAGGVVAGELKDLGKKKFKPRFISLRTSRVNSILGTEISSSDVRRILEDLQFGIISKRKDTFKTKVPSFREDVTREIDLIEEIARIYGYDNIGLTLPRIMGLSKTIQHQEFLASPLKNLIKETLTSLGMSEVITYSLVNKNLLNALNLELNQVIEIKNPLSYEQEVMQTTLLVGLLNTVAWNLNRKIGDVEIFQLASVYLKGKSEHKFLEVPRLAIAITGRRSKDWRDKANDVNFFDLKGVVETLLSQMGVVNYCFIPEAHPALVPGQAASLKISRNKTCAFIGKVSPDILERFDIHQDVYIGELEIDVIAQNTQIKKTFRQIPKYPAVSRDLAIIAKNDISSGKIVETILQTKEPLLKKVVLFDQYYGEQIPESSRGLAYSMEYSREDRTLIDEEVNEAHSKICQHLMQKLGVQVR